MPRESERSTRSRIASAGSSARRVGNVRYNLGLFEVSSNWARLLQPGGGNVSGTMSLLCISATHCPTIVRLHSEAAKLHQHKAITEYSFYFGLKRHQVSRWLFLFAVLTPWLQRSKRSCNLRRDSCSAGSQTNTVRNASLIPSRAQGSLPPHAVPPPHPN